MRENYILEEHKIIILSNIFHNLIMRKNKNIYEVRFILYYIKGFYQCFLCDKNILPEST